MAGSTPHVWWCDHRIAGVVFRTSVNVDPSRLWSTKFEPFRVSLPDDEEPDVVHTLTWVGHHLPGEHSATSASPSVHCRRAGMRAGRADGARHEGFTGRFESSWQGCRALVTCDYLRREVDITLEDPGAVDLNSRRPLSFLWLAANLRQLFATFLPEWRTLLLHACGVLVEGRCALFLAPDGGGKSTVASHAGDLVVMDDDHLAVTVEERGVIAHTSPLGARLTRPMEAPVAGLFFLEKDQGFRVEPWSRLQAISFLWQDNASKLGLASRLLRAQAFSLMTQLCARVPLFRVRFPRDSFHWEAIREICVRIVPRSTVH